MRRYKIACTSSSRLETYDETPDQKVPHRYIGNEDPYVVQIINDLIAVLLHPFSSLPATLLRQLGGGHHLAVNQRVINDFTTLTGRRGRWPPKPVRNLRHARDRSFE